MIFLKFLDARFGGHPETSAKFCRYCRECTSVCGQFHREVASAGILTRPLLFHFARGILLDMRTGKDNIVLSFPEEVVIS